MNRTSLTSLLRGWKRGAGKRLPALLAAGALAAMLNSCGDNVVETKSESQRIKDATNKTASVSIFIRDGGGTGGVSNEFVSVEFYGTSGSSYEVQTVNLGTETKGKNYEVTRGGVVFKDVPIGTYAARVSKTEYATYFIEKIAVEYEEGVLENDVLVPRSVAVDAWLYPLTASVTGQVAFSGLKKSKADGVADGAQVTLEITNTSLESRVFTTTASNGKFSFSELPGGLGLKGKVFATLDGYASDASDEINLLPGVSNSVPKTITIKEVAGVLAVIDYPLETGVDDEIVITFGEALKSAGAVSVKVGFDPEDATKGIAVPFTYEVDGANIKLSPTYNWLSSTGVSSNLQGPLTITLGLVKSATNKSLSGESYNVTVVGDAAGRDGRFFVASGLEVFIPTNETPIVVAFSEALDTSKIVLWSNIVPPGNLKPGSIYSEDLKSITLTPFGFWTGDAVKLSGVISISGDVITKDIKVNITAAKFRIENDAEDVYLSGATDAVTLKFTKDIFVGNKLKANPQVKVNGEDTATASGDKKFSFKIEDDKRTVVVSAPSKGWAAETNVLTFTGFQSVYDEDLEWLGAKKQIDVKLALQTLKISSETRKFNVSRGGAEPITVSFNYAINVDSIKGNSTHLTFVPAENTVTVTYSSDKKSMVLTPTGTWFFGSEETINFFVNRDLVSTEPGVKSLVAIVGADDKGNPIYDTLKIGRPEQDVKIAGVATTVIDSVLAQTSAYPRANAGHKVRVLFSRVANDNSAGNELVYVLYRVNPDASGSDPRTAIPVNHVKAPTGGIGTSLKLEGGIEQGKNIFYITPVTTKDGWDGTTNGLANGGILNDGIPGPKVEVSTRPTIASVEVVSSDPLDEGYKSATEYKPGSFSDEGTKKPHWKVDGGDDWKNFNLVLNGKLAAGSDKDEMRTILGGSGSLPAGQAEPTGGYSLSFRVVFTERMNSAVTPVAKVDYISDQLATEVGWDMDDNDGKTLLVNLTPKEGATVVRSLLALGGTTKTFGGIGVTLSGIEGSTGEPFFNQFEYTISEAGGGKKSVVGTDVLFRFKTVLPRLSEAGTDDGFGDQDGCGYWGANWTNDGDEGCKYTKPEP